MQSYDINENSGSIYVDVIALWKILSHQLTLYNLNPTSKLLGSPSYARIVLLARKTALAFLHHKNNRFWVLVWEWSSHMVKIVRVSFPPLWQNIDTVLLLITNDRRVVTRLLHQTKQGILLLARKSRNFNTHAHLNTTVMMHFQSRFQYTSTGRMDKLRAPDKVYPCGRYGIWIESASLQFYLERVFKCACVIKFLLSSPAEGSLALFDAKALLLPIDHS